MGEFLADELSSVSVSDVYDLACEIGKDCETLIAGVGADPVNSLIKKVIVSLELLERFAIRNEQENEALAEMSQRIEKLEAEKRLTKDHSKKFEIEIETVEEQWRNESRELLKLVTRLQDENKKLLQNSGRNGGGIGAAGQSQKSSNGDVAAELENMQKVFRNEVENHKNEIKRREEEVNAQQEEIVNLQLQIETLKATNADAKRLQRELQGQIRTLVDERTNLITRIQDQHTDIVALKRVTAAMQGSVQHKEPIGDHGVTESKVIAGEKDKCANSTNDTRSSGDIDDEEDPPVQGPMPYEPDDAPWKRRTRRDSESGIRKFFRQLFLETDKAPSPFSFTRRGTTSSYTGI